MTSKRNRSGTQKPREDTFNWVRENPEITPTQVLGKLELMQQQIINMNEENDSFNIDEVYYVPSIQNISRNWVPQAQESLLSEEVQELLKPYNPVVTHNSPFWKGSNALYTFTSEDKFMLVNLYNQLREVWFFPLGVKEDEMTNNQAMWLCIIANTVEELKSYPVDIFLIANYFATKYLVGLQTKTHGLGVAPVATVDKADIDYVLHIPYQSKKHYVYWRSLQESGAVPESNSEWFFLLSQKYNKYDDKWFIDFPMNWASQLDSFQWLPPYQRVMFILGTFLQSYIMVLDKNSKYYAYRNHDWVNKILMHLQSVRDRIMTKKTRDEMGVTPVVFNDKNEELKKITIKFNASHFNRYMKLLVSLGRLDRTLEKGSVLGLKSMADDLDMGLLTKPIEEYYSVYDPLDYKDFSEQVTKDRIRWGIADRVEPMVNPKTYDLMFNTTVDIPVDDTFFKVEDTTTYFNTKLLNDYAPPKYTEDPETSYDEFGL